MQKVQSVPRRRGLHCICMDDGPRDPPIIRLRGSFGIWHRELHPYILTPGANRVGGRAAVALLLPARAEQDSSGSSGEGSTPVTLCAHKIDAASSQ